MVGIKSVAQEFRDFTDWLCKNRADTMVRLQNLPNGFEGWMKIEFFMWLTSYRKPNLTAESPFTPCNDADVGLEYKVKLDSRFSDVERGSVKQCDLWIGSERPNLFHYVELKAPFANSNKGKMLKAAGDDFWYMSRIRKTHEHAASGNAIVFGVRFDPGAWDEALRTISFLGGIPDEAEMHKGEMPEFEKFRWCIFTKTYD